MGFVSKQISKEEAQSLMKKYKISSPWPGRDETAVANMASASVYNADADALFAIIRVNFGAAVEGYRNFDGFDAVGVLIWKDAAVRVDYYENLIDKGKKIFLVATSSRQAELALLPGMNVSAEITTGKRRIIEFFLDPLMTKVDESVKVR